jgi:putative ABC transport system permease protein
MRFAVLTVWHEKRRFLAGVLAVAVSTVLISLMVGILLGLFALVSLPIDLATADIWIAARGTPSCDLATLISREQENDLLMQPGVMHVDELIQAFAAWNREGLGSVLIVVLGVNVGPSSLGPVQPLTEEDRALLTEEGAVIVDRNDGQRLGVRRVGETAEIRGRQVRVVGFTSGLGSMTGPYVFCSLQTARMLLNLRPDETTFILGVARDPVLRAAVLSRVNARGKVSAYAADEFSRGSRFYWLRTTKAGLGVGFMALISLASGALVTSQTLYSATVAASKELALLRALGAPRWRLRRFVLEQSLLVGGFGVIVGVPVSYAAAFLARAVGARILSHPLLMAGALSLTLFMALVAGLVALRSLNRTEPAQLLR